MLSVEVDEARGIVTLQPDGALSAADFAAATRIVDPYIEADGVLHGVIIHSEHFPGWDSFASLLSHIRFVRDHHQQVARVALVTDSAIANLAERLGGHFIHAEIRAFHYSQLAEAREWIAAAGRE